MNDWPVRELGIGVIAGGVAAAGIAFAHARRRRLPDVGWAYIAATLVGLAWTGGVPVAAVVAVVGVGAARAMVRSPAIAVIAALPFALALSFSKGVPDVVWAHVLVVVAASLGAVLVSMTDGALRGLGVAPLLFAGSAAGVFLAVPDTERAAVALGVAVALVALGRASLGSSGAAAATALIVWITAAGSTQRPPALVGGIACLGVLVALPIGRSLVRRRRSAPAASTLLAGVHGALALTASRVAGIRSDAGVAAFVAGASAVAAIAAIAALEASGCADGSRHTTVGRRR